MPIGSEHAPAGPQLGVAAARLLPVTTTAFAALLMLEPVPLPGYAVLTPAFTLMAVYHWTLYRPDLLSPVALFVIGLGDDLLSGDIVGVTPLLLLLSRAAVLRSRRWFIERGFAFVWAGFAVLAAGATLGLWMIQCLLAWRFIDAGGSIFRAALSAALFPVVSLLLGRAQRALMAPG
jgi:rod shape-determining protein MreD